MTDLIDRYAAGADVPLAAIAGLSAAGLDARPAPGWSVREIVAHLADSDLVGTDRMRRVAAMEDPTLLPYDQDAFAARLGYATADVVLAAEAFRANRLLMADVLRRLPAAAFDRAGTHTERGRMTLADLVGVYVGHLEHHMRFLRDKRALLGK